MSPQVNPEPVSPATLPPVKSGVRSSEFIVSLAILILASAGLLSGKLDPVWFALLLGLVGVVYNHLRTTLKSEHLDLYATLLETAYENAPFNVGPIKPAAPIAEPAAPAMQTHPAPAPLVETDPAKIAFRL